MVKTTYKFQSSLSTLRATNLRETLQKEDRKRSLHNVNTKRVPLVAYSDSKSSSSDDDGNGRLSSPTPVTPFYGKRGHVSKF